MTRDALVDAAHREGLPEIAIPRDVVQVATLPLLGSGKTDYAAVLRLAAAGGRLAPRRYRRRRGIEPRRQLNGPREARNGDLRGVVRSCEIG